MKLYKWDLVLVNPEDQLPPNVDVECGTGWDKVTLNPHVSLVDAFKGMSLVGGFIVYIKDGCIALEDPTAILKPPNDRSIHREIKLSCRPGPFAIDLDQNLIVLLER